jgi:hypothetical protein
MKASATGLSLITHFTNNPAFPRPSFSGKSEMLAASHEKSGPWTGCCADIFWKSWRRAKINRGRAAPSPALGLRHRSPMWPASVPTLSTSTARPLVGSVNCHQSECTCHCCKRSCAIVLREWQGHRPSNPGAVCYVLGLGTPFSAAVPPHQKLPSSEAQALAFLKS